MQSRRGINLLLFLSLSFIVGCGSDGMSELDGYWRLKPPLQSRSLQNIVVHIDGQQASVLSYVGGPMLNPGVNTEGTSKKLMGTFRCANLDYYKGELAVRPHVLYDLNNTSDRQDIDALYFVNVVSSDTLQFTGLTKNHDWPFVKEENLLTSEEAAFKSFFEECY